MTSSDLWTVRPMRDGDRSFVTHSWITNYKANSFLGNQTKKGFEEGMLPFVEQALDEDGCMVACAKEASEVILAYLCYRVPNVVHFAYTKSGFRRNGIQRSLFESAGLKEGDPINASHYNHTARRLQERFPWLGFNHFEFYRMPKRVP